MSTAQILGLGLCLLVAVVSLILYLRLSFGVWIRNLRFKAPPSEVPSYLIKTALALFVTCVSAYVTLLIVDWRFISWFWAFWGLTLVVLFFGIGNLWWEIHWGRQLHRACKERTVEIDQDVKETDGMNE